MDNNRKSSDFRNAKGSYEDARNSQNNEMRNIRNSQDIRNAQDTRNAQDVRNTQNNRDLRNGRNDKKF